MLLGLGKEASMEEVRGRVVDFISSAMGNHLRALSKGVTGSDLNLNF